MDSHLAGIDVSKAHLDVAVRAADGRRLDRFRVPNTDAGRREMIARLPAGAKIAYEPTASYHRAVEGQLHAAGFRLKRVNPLQAHRYAQGRGRGDKTDALDAATLADMAADPRCGYDGYVPPTPLRQRLSDLHARLTRLSEMIAAENNRAEHATDPEIRRSLEAVTRMLKKEKARIAAEFDRVAAEDAEVRRQMQRIQSIPGVGPATARAVIAELPDLMTFRDAAQVAAFAGLAPVLRQSGSSLHRATIPPGGRPGLRAALLLPTLVAITYNPDVRAAYQRLIARGKSKMSAVLAAAHKLLKIIYGVVKHDAPYTPRIPHVPA